MSSLSLPATATLGYGGLIWLGGFLGFILAGSTASLVMSTIFGLCLIASGLAMNKGLLLGKVGATGLTLFLTIFFAYRFYLAFTAVYQSGQPFPFLRAFPLYLSLMGLFTLYTLLMRSKPQEKKL